jgi:uncharacterized protein involved in tolerance to divalent cations
MFTRICVLHRYHIPRITKMGVLEVNGAFEDVGGQYQLTGTLVI